MTNLQPTAQTGALTLVLLAKMYRSQMIALLVKNGIVVDDNASEEQITSLMSNLLKVSKSFAQDLNDFITNPSVTDALLGGMTQTAQYFQMSGDDFFNVGGVVPPLVLTNSAGKPYGSYTTDPALPQPSEKETKKEGFFSGLNAGDLLTKGMNLFGDYTKAQSDAEIAKQRGLIARYEAESKSTIYTDPKTGKVVQLDGKGDTGLGTTTIVVLSLVGVALIGTVIYFIARPKN